MWLITYLINQYKQTIHTHQQQQKSKQKDNENHSIPYILNDRARFGRRMSKITNRHDKFEIRNRSHDTYWNAERKEIINSICIKHKTTHKHNVRWTIPICFMFVPKYTKCDGIYTIFCLCFDGVSVDVLSDNYRLQMIYLSCKFSIFPSFFFLFWFSVFFPNI